MKYLVAALCFIALLSSCKDDGDGTTTPAETGDPSILWEKELLGQFGGTEIIVSKVVSDKFDNIYIAGGFEGTINFNDEEFGFLDLVLESEGRLDPFLVKYDKNGVPQWLRTCNTPSQVDDYFTDMVLVNDEIWVCGVSDIAQTFMTFDLSGNNTWTDNSRLEAYSMDADASGNVYVSGAARRGNGDVYTIIEKVTSGKSVEWVKEFDTYEDSEDKSSEVGVFDDGSVLLASPYEKGLALRKFSSTGDSIWTKGLNDGAKISVRNLYITNEDKVLINGVFTGARTTGSIDLGIDLDPSEEVARFTNARIGLDRFFVLLDNDGKYIWGDDLFTDLWDETYEMIDYKGGFLISGKFVGGIYSGGSSTTGSSEDIGVSRDRLIFFDKISGSPSVYDFAGDDDLDLLMEGIVSLSDNSLVTVGSRGPSEIDPGTSDVIIYIQRRE